MEQKRRMNASEKMMILRELLENRVPIGELAQKYNLHPNVIYKWKKILFEKGEELFSEQRQKKSGKEYEKILRLEAKLKDKDALISEIVEDNIRLKKNMNGER